MAQPQPNPTSFHTILQHFSMPHIIMGWDGMGYTMGTSVANRSKDFSLAHHIEKILQQRTFITTNEETQRALFVTFNKRQPGTHFFHFQSAPATLSQHSLRIALQYQCSSHNPLELMQQRNKIIT